MRALVIESDKVSKLIGVEYDGSLRETRLYLSLRYSNATDRREAAERVLVERVPTVIKDLIMLVDEEARFKALPLNQRASLLYPGPIYGPVLLTYEEPVYKDDELVDKKWIGIPDDFNWGLIAEAAADRITQLANDLLLSAHLEGL